MDKITIFLQDKTTIEDLVKDPEMQIKIKDAILDKIGRMALKITNVTNDIIRAAKSEIRDQFLKECSFYTPELKDEWETVVRSQAHTEFQEMVNKELKELRIEFRHELHERKEAILKEIEDLDIESIIRDVAEKVIREKFK